MVGGGADFFFFRPCPCDFLVGLGTGGGLGEGLEDVGAAAEVSEEDDTWGEGAA